MTDYKELTAVYRQNLEESIIACLAMDARYLAADLIENEPELFE